MRCRYNSSASSASRSSRRREESDLPASTASESSREPQYWAGSSVNSRSSKPATVDTSYHSDGREHPRQDSYESPRYPHWFGRQFRSPSKSDHSPSKQALIERLEAVHAENRELNERMRFFQKRLRQVARERDATYKRYFDPRWEKARLFSKWMWPDLAEDTCVDEVIVDEIIVDDVPEWVTNWDYLKR